MNTRAQHRKNRPGSTSQTAASPTPTKETYRASMAFQRPAGAFSGACDLSQIDTTPGASGPMAPPPNFTGTPDQYLDLIRERYRLDLASRSQIQSYARAMDHRPDRKPTTIGGPYATTAREILRAINQRSNTP